MELERWPKSSTFLNSFVHHFFFSKIGENTWKDKFNWGIGRTYYWVCFSFLAFFDGRDVSAPTERRCFGVAML
jgi:hypothetical protein